MSFNLLEDVSLRPEISFIFTVIFLLPVSILQLFNINQNIDLNVYLCRTIKNYDFINDWLR